MPTVDIDTAIEKSGFGKTQLLYILASSTVFFIELLNLVSDGVLLPTIKCEWNLTNLQASGYLLSTRVAFFVGGMIGGSLGDKLGRRFSIILGLAFQILMTNLSLHSYSMFWYTVFHALNKIAFGIVMPSAYAITIEVCPRSMRFLVKIIFGLAGSLGAFFGATIGQFYEFYGWRNILLLVSLFCVMPLVSMFLLDPSIRHLAVNNRIEEAENVLRRIYRRNGCEASMKNIHLRKQVIIEKGGSYKELFRHGLRKSSIRLIYMMLVKGVFISTMHISIQYIFASNTSSGPNNTHGDNCFSMNSKTYSQIALAFLPDFIIHPSALIVAQYKGRIHAISSCFLLSSIALVTASVLPTSKMFSIFVGIGLASTYAARSTVVLYTSELYPTTLRSVSNGMVWSADCMGSFVSPLLTEFVVITSPRFFMAVTAFFLMTSSLVARGLKRETLGEPLMASVEELNHSDNAPSENV